MSNELFVPARLDSLPTFATPANLNAAATTILGLGRNIHEHAYLIGKTLAWVKEYLEHGHWLPWLAENVWFSQRTARNFITFAAECDDVSERLVYEPGKSAMVADLDTADDLSPDDPLEAEVIEDPEDRDDEEGSYEDEEGESMPERSNEPAPRAPGQEFVEERRVIGEVLTALKSCKGRILRISHRYGLSPGSRKALRPLLVAMLAEIKEE